MSAAQPGVVCGVLLLLSACSPPEDCSFQQGWSDETLAGLSSEPAPFTPLTPSFSEFMIVAAGVPVTRQADGGFIAGVIVSPGSFTMPVSVQSLRADGAKQPFFVTVFVDGEPVAAELRQDGGVVASPHFDSGPIANFEVAVPEPAMPGAHDFVLFIVQEDGHAAGLPATWLDRGTTLVGAGREAARGTIVPRKESGSVFFMADGGLVAGTRAGAPEGGRFEWMAHFEGGGAGAMVCRGVPSRLRLVSFLDGAPHRFEGGVWSIDVDVPQDAALEAPVVFPDLPMDGGHVLTPVVFEGVARYQVRPDGSISPWFSPLVQSLLVAHW